MMEQPQLDCLMTELAETEMKFQRACEQIVLLNCKLSEMKDRYDQAAKKNLRMFRYTFRIQLAIIEGTKNMFDDYAATQADKIQSLQLQIYGEVLVDSDDKYDLGTRA